MRMKDLAIHYQDGRDFADLQLLVMQQNEMYSRTTTVLQMALQLRTVALQNSI